MNEESKSIWKKSRNLPGSFLGWLILVTGIALFISLLGALIVDGMRWKEDWRAVAVIIVISVAGTSLFFFIRWLCCWRNFRRFLLGLAGLAVLIALFYAEEDWRGWHAWQKFKHEWEAKGERFDMASVIPPTVPNDQNFAMAPIWVESMKAVLGPKNSRSWFGNKFPDNGRTNFTDRLALDIVRNNDWGNEPTNGNWAKGTITDLKPWQTYYRTPAATNRDSTIETNEFSVALQPQSPAADVLLALGKYDSTIEELRQASLLPYSRFPLNYDDENPAEIMLPHLAALKRCAQVLEQRAVAELQNNQSEKALEDIKLTLRLTAFMFWVPSALSLRRESVRASMSFAFSRITLVRLFHNTSWSAVIFKEPLSSLIWASVCSTAVVLVTAVDFFLPEAAKELSALAKKKIDRNVTITTTSAA